MMVWTIYLVALHVLAIPGAYMALGVGLTIFLDSTTNVLTGEPKPAARGIGWAVIGGAIVAGLCFVHGAWQ